MLRPSALPASPETVELDIESPQTLPPGPAEEKRSERPGPVAWFRDLFAYRGFLALCDQGVVSVGNFLTGLALGRLVGKSELGLYALCWTIVSSTVDLSGALTTTPYTVFGPHMNDSRRRLYVGNMFLLHCAISMAAAFFLAVGAGILTPERTVPGMMRALITTAAVLTLLNTREFVRRICFADMRVAMALALDVIFTTVHLVGLMVLWRKGALNASAVYILLGAVSLGHSATWLLLYRSKISLGQGWWAEGRKNWRFAKWVLGSALLWTLATYLYPWLLNAYHGTVSAGLWASCAAIVAVGNPVLGGLVNYLGPKLSTLYARSGLDSMTKYVYKSSLLLVLMLSPFAIVLSIWGSRIMTSLYGPSYAGTQTILILLSLNLLALSFSQPYSRGLFTLAAAKADTLVNVMAVALLFSVGVMAVKFYSVQGAAAALLLSTFATAAVRVAAFKRTAGSARLRATLPQPEIAAASGT
ncbi:MAG TPA: hypothetical protein VGG72_01815 [Bryobacteraceae bacterium]|jgi:O-antigen/teichoic acid export membrane protein